jgi:transitional endoplasmic reticulum ATPase
MALDPQLEALRQALEATPHNEPLLGIYLRALVAAEEHALALQLVRTLAPEKVKTSDLRVLITQVLQRAGDHAHALSWLEGETADLLVARARSLLALGREGEAKEAYRRGIAQNATLEDPTLEALVSARVVELSPDRPRLRVVSNDDTTREDVDRALAPDAPPIKFADVGGLEAVKRQIEKRIILPFQKPSLFQRFKKRVGGGILLYGPPGCGKTMLARATAGECNARFFNVAISDVLDMYIGESERKLEALFERARAAAPAVLFFDELEALAAKRQFSREGNSAKLVSQFLAQMDGFAQNNHGVLMLGATNVPWAVDPAFRRPGRFDRVMFVPPPDREARESILTLALHDRPLEKGIDVRFIAGQTSGFSGADLSGLVEEAADLAISESLKQGNEVPIKQAHLVAALEDVRPTTHEWLTTARNYARYANEGGQYDEVLAFLKQHAKS